MLYYRTTTRSDTEPGWGSTTDSSSHSETDASSQTLTNSSTSKFSFRGWKIKCRPGFFILIPPTCRATTPRNTESRSTKDSSSEPSTPTQLSQPTTNSSSQDSQPVAAPPTNNNDNSGSASPEFSMERDLADSCSISSETSTEYELIASIYDFPQMPRYRPRR